MRIGFAVVLASTVLAAPAHAQWSGHVGAGLPILEGDEIKLSGELGAGYATENFRVYAEGGISFYDLDRAGIISENYGLQGALSAGYLTGDASSAFRFEVAFSGGGALYDSTLIDSTGNNPTLKDHTSTMGRGSLLLGGRTRLGLFSASLLAGGGAQYEEFNALSATGTVMIQDTATLSLQFNGRLHARVLVVEGWVGTRAEVRFQRFDITRDDTIIRVDQAGSADTDGAFTSTTQTEISARLFIDVEVARFAGFVPSLFAGVNSVTISGDAGSSAVLVPVFGVTIASYDDV